MYGGAIRCASKRGTCEDLLTLFSLVKLFLVVEKSQFETQPMASQKQQDLVPHQIVICSCKNKPPPMLLVSSIYRGYWALSLILGFVEWVRETPECPDQWHSKAKWGEQDCVSECKYYGCANDVADPMDTPACKAGGKQKKRPLGKTCCGSLSIAELQCFQSENGCAAEK